MASQKSKDKHWLTQSCKDADLELDEQMELEMGAKDSEDEESEYLLLITALSLVL